MTSLQQVLPTIEKPSIRQGVVHIDRARAERWLKENPYPRQRTKDQSFIDGLIDALKNDQWTVREIQFAVLPDGTEQLIDGQHGLSAIAQSGIPGWCRVAWQDFPDQDAIDHAYARIDAGRSRGMKDALMALGVGVDCLEHKSDVARLAAAVTLIQTAFLGFGGIPMQDRGSLKLRNRDEKARICNAWMTEMEEFVALTGKPLKRLSGLFRLSGVTAIGLVTLRYDNKRATEFWNAVAQHATIKHDSPIHRFRELIVGDKSSRGGAYASRYTTNAWNAWCSGEETSRLFVFNERSIIRISGTPYTGRKHLFLGDLPSAKQWAENRRRPVNQSISEKHSADAEADEEVALDDLVARMPPEIAKDAFNFAIGMALAPEAVGADTDGAGSGVRADHSA